MKEIKIRSDLPLCGMRVIGYEDEILAWGGALIYKSCTPGSLHPGDHGHLVSTCIRRCFTRLSIEMLRRAASSACVRMVGSCCFRSQVGENSFKRWSPSLLLKHAAKQRTACITLAVLQNHGASGRRIRSTAWCLKQCEARTCRLSQNDDTQLSRTMVLILETHETHVGHIMETDICL